MDDVIVAITSIVVNTTIALSEKFSIEKYKDKYPIKTKISVCKEDILCHMYD